MSSPSYDCLSLTFDNGLARLRFTRPELLNRFDKPLHNEFAQALVGLLQNQDVRVLILSAEGKVFSAGGDMEMMLDFKTNKPLRDHMAAESKVIFETLNLLPFPVIAAVQGAAAGLGASIVTSADIVVAARDIKLSDPHVVLGLVAGDGGVLSWSRAIGMTRAKRYLLTGDRITGAEAFAMGLVTDLVDTPAEVEPLAEKIAQKILSLPRDGVVGTKRAFSALAQHYSGAVYDVGMAFELGTLAGEELHQAVKAVLKR